MRGPKKAAIAHKKPNAEILKQRKVNADAAPKKDKENKKNTGAPKRPPGAFFVFMEEFRKNYKENFPNNKSVSVVGKAGGEKWKSMTESEKSPYVAKATKRMVDYQIALEAFNNKLNCGTEDANAEEIDNSTSEVHDEESVPNGQRKWKEL